LNSAMVSEEQAKPHLTPNRQINLLFATTAVDEAKPGSGEENRGWKMGMVVSGLAAD
jgi:hypothetical protein